MLFAFISQIGTERFQTLNLFDDALVVEVPQPVSFATKTSNLIKFSHCIDVSEANETSSNAFGKLGAQLGDIFGVQLSTFD